MLKRSRGRYTDEQVLRCAKMSGAFGKQIGRLFSATGLADVDLIGRHKPRSGRYQDDIANIVKEYRQDALHDYAPPRKHQSFKYFHTSSKVLNQRALGRKLNEECKKIDLWKRIRDREMRS